MNERLRDMVAQKLREDWSPEQISGWLKREYPEDKAMHISHETIYRTLFVQARGALKRELLAHLRSGRMMRKGRHVSTTCQQRGQIEEAVCAAYFQRNVLAHVPTSSMGEVAEDRKAIFKVRRKKTALALAEEFAEVYRKRFPKVLSVCEAGKGDALTYFALSQLSPRENTLDEHAGYACSRR